MPELPEVETSRRGIEPHIVNQTISKIIVRERKLRWPIPDNIHSLSHNQSVEAVLRRGKYLILQLQHGYILIHLGMSGSLRITDTNRPPDKHDHVDFLFKNNKVLRFHDPRKFGCILWTNNHFEKHKLLHSLGPEPLDKAFNGEYLYQYTRKRQVNIKTCIMNSQAVVGVGNIYASESLFKAGINPKTKAGRLSKQRCHKLVDAIQSTLKEAISAGGTTLRDFTNGDGKPGYFAQQLSVYGRADLPCQNCKTPIKQFIQQQRSTFYCPQCQR